MFAQAYYGPRNRFTELLVFIIILFTMRPYYDMSFVVRPGWRRVTSLEVLERTIFGETMVFSGETGSEIIDWKHWPDKPHVAFANLDLMDPETLKMFTKTYGPVIADLTKLPAADHRFEVDLYMVVSMRERVRSAWRAKDAKRLWLSESVERYDMPFTVSGKTLQLAPNDVFTYLRLLLTRDISEGRARICNNPDCATPYFITKRSDQTHCEWKCTNLIQQRKYRERLHQKKRRAK
jgi:hypothetical protein